MPTSSLDISRPDISQLPFLIRLVDDPSPIVRDKVTRVLRAFGPQLSLHVMALQITLSPSQKAALARIVGSDDEGFRSDWRRWVDAAQRTTNELQTLETGLDLLGRWQLERDGENVRHDRTLRRLLDNLAEDFLDRDNSSDMAPDAEELSRWLFSSMEDGGQGFEGAPGDDYYNPLNSNLIWAIENGRGLPITLTCLFMLVGDRLDMKIHGCSFPGHFLARVREDNRDWLFDPFNSGRMLSEGEVSALRKVAPRELSEPPTALEIVTRVLHNMVNAYRQSDSELLLPVLLELLNDLQRTQPNASAY